MKTIYSIIFENSATCYDSFKEAFKNFKRYAETDSIFTLKKIKNGNYQAYICKTTYVDDEIVEDKIVRNEKDYLRLSKRCH